MEAAAVASPSPQRPHHRRNASSKSNMLRALVSPNKSRADDAEQEASSSQQNNRTQTVPLLPADHPHAGRSKVLGERQSNARSPPTSPSKSRQKSIAVSQTSHDLRFGQSPTKSKKKDGGPTMPKKSKSSANLSGMFSKMNRSNKDLSAQVPREKDKENATPPTSSDSNQAPAETPIWAQYSSSAKPKANSRPSTRDGEERARINVKEEIAKYTPQDYSPSKQRNFNGSFDQPQLRPTLGRSRPDAVVNGTDIMAAIGRRVSGDRTSFDGRKSEEHEARRGRDLGHRTSGTKTGFFQDRKASGSSTEQAPAKDRLNIAKREAGGRVKAAVAAFQGKTGGKDQQPVAREERILDESEVNKQFESVLDSRNVPEPMRQKMRSLTLRVKADFIKQDLEAGKGTGSTSSTTGGGEPSSPVKRADTSPEETKKADEDDAKSTKRRSRPRSRTFTFSKGDKRTNDGTTSPSKKQRSQSKSRGASTTQDQPLTVATTPRSSSKKRDSLPTVPSDYISYLRTNTDPVKLEVGRLHKLRILLRNETVSWVDGFLSLGGMTQITSLLLRIMEIEWREEHEDQLLHEALLCLKGLCTTERAMGELETVADDIFPKLVWMLFDEEKKGPAEYVTRGIVMTVLFNYLSAATTDSPSALEQRARKILTYLGEPTKAETDRPVDFVMDMRVPRPYKLWCREVSNVTKEVFWIFLHHLNVIPLPRPTTTDTDEDERANALESTYTRRHFPGIRPPVPAAPYIGGVEWDATTYITAHLDLLNGLIASIPTTAARNTLRSELHASGFEKVLGNTLRTCKEKFYGGVHDGLRAWVAAAREDGWETQGVREGPTLEEQARGYSPKKSPNKKKAEPAPKLDLGPAIGGGEKKGKDEGEDEGWLG